MRSQEFTGKTTQEAIDTGLAALGVTIADVHVDVLQEGAKGLFGLFGSKPARVRLTVMEDEKEDDHGLSDLLSSFSLNDAPRKKQAAPRPEKKEKKPDAVLIFIIPPSLDELKRRLVARGTDTERAIEARLIRARQEYKEADFYQYIIVNDDAEKAAKELSAIITAERCKAENRINFLKEV